MRKRKARRRLSMTSLIDVIFLLLLFFMLSSTFSRFAEVELAAASGGAAAPTPEQRLVFLQLGPDRLTLNGETTALADLPTALSDDSSDPRSLLVSLSDGVASQRLIDLLVALRGIEGVNVTVLEAS